MESTKTILDINQNTSLEDRVKGSILGFAIGDSLGAPVEFRKQNPKVKDFEPAYRKGLKAGQYTDDTQHLMIALDSLIENRGKIIIEDIAERLRLWYNSGEARSLGRTTKLAIERLNRGISPYKSGIDNINNCGALALARLLPYSLFSALVPLNYKLTKKDTQDILSITHAHKKVLSMGGLLNYYVQGMVHGNSARGVTYQIIVENEFLNKRVRNRLKQIIETSDDKTIDSFDAIKDIGDSGFVEDIMYSALFSTFRGPTFTDAILNSVNGLGDSDTRAAITGALYGLQIGYSRLPQKWKDEVESSKDLLEKAGELYKLAV